jgi:hypothetical protein
VYTPAVADMVSMAARLERDVTGGQIVTKTLDALNGSAAPYTYGMGFGAHTGLSNNADHHFQTSVLNAAYSGRGTFVDIIS